MAREGGAAVGRMGRLLRDGDQSRDLGRRHGLRRSGRRPESGELLDIENWGIPVWVGLALIIAVFGLFRARSVDLMTRWRVIASFFAVFLPGSALP